MDDDSSDLTTRVEEICIQKSYTKIEKLKLLALTFNVNAKIEESENIEKLFFFNDLKCRENRADIIIIGLQEVVELSATNVVGSAVLGNITESLDKWVKMFEVAVNAGLTDRNDPRYGLPFYKLFQVNQMVGTAAIMFVLQILEDSIKNVQTATVPRGMGNVLGNKGGVCIRFEIGDTSICLVAAHLSAHRENVTKRNDDYYAIVTSKIFQDYMYEKPKQYSDANLNKITKDIKNIRSKLPPSILAKTPVISDELLNLSMFAPDDHDIIIWLGDLNYRIKDGLGMDEVYKLIFDSSWDELSLSDQLVLEMNEGNAFECFIEGKLDFPPTYQYIPGSDLYDRRIDKKMRCPAWCDRILWRVGKGIEKMKSALMNQYNDGNVMTDMMRHPYPSIIRYLSPDALHNTAINASNKNKKKFISIVPVKTMKGSQRENLGNLSLSELRSFIYQFYDYNNLEKVELLGLEVCDSQLSDHKPVKALLEIDCKSVDYSQREQALMEGMQEYLLQRHAWDIDQTHFLVSPSLYIHDIEGMKRGSNKYSLTNKPINSLTPKLCSNMISIQKAMLIGPISPISVEPTYLVITPSLSKGLNMVSLTNIEDGLKIDFVVLETSIPAWLNVTPMFGRLNPYQTFSLIVEFNSNIFTELSIDKNQNLEGLVVLQYMEAIEEKEMDNYLDQRPSMIPENIASVVDKLIIPVSYEVYHEV